MAGRKRKLAEPTDVQLQEQATAAHHEQVEKHLAEQPDVFDAVIAARAAEEAQETHVEPRAEIPTPQVTLEQRVAHTADHTVPHAAENGQPHHRPDPFPMETILLGMGEDAPRMRLFRNSRAQQVAIQFDERPDPKYTGMLRESGFQWRQYHGVWEKPLPREEKWRTMADAERLFRDIANGIRQDRGFEPHSMGMGA